MTLLEVKGIDAHYGASQVLHAVSLQVEAGSIVCVVGRNGMGKTTLIHTIMGFIRASAGEISFDGMPITSRRADQIARLGIALVPQGKRIFKSLTVGENLLVAARTTGEHSWGVDRVCEVFPMLADRWRQPAGQLSGGQQQMVAIGRALVRGARVMLMDEPTEGLDRVNTRATIEATALLAGSGGAVLLVEQRLGVAIELADSMHILSRGEIVHTEPGDVVRQSPHKVIEKLGFVVSDKAS